MSDHSKIEWCTASWNPIRGLAPNRWMCRRISPGCDRCYASTMNHRWGGQEYEPVNGSAPQVRLDAGVLALPLKWRQPRRVFVCSMTDLFGEWVPDEWIDRLFAVMALTPRHQYQVLTKRPKRMRDYLSSSAAPKRIGQYMTLPLILTHPGSIEPPGDMMAEWFRHGVPWPLPNVWLGTSIELNRYSWRANPLRATPAAVRFISAEPLLGPLPGLDLTGIDWLITGGESGAGHRPCEVEWVRDLRDRCQAQGTAYFFKQWGGRTHAEGGRILDGQTWDEFPTLAREVPHGLAFPHNELQPRASTG